MDPARPPVILPLDGSAEATAALPMAKLMADLARTALHIVHVGEPILPPDELLRRLIPREQMRDTAVAQVGGAPAAGIVRLASEWHSPLIVMCTHTKPGGVGHGLGSVAEAVVRAAPCPVVLVRPELGMQPRVLRRAVVPHDGTPTTATALRAAVELVEHSGTEVDVLHVAAPDSRQQAEPGTLTVPRYVDQPQHEWPAWAHEFLQRMQSLSSTPPGVRMRLFLRAGEPGAEIVRFARERQGDLIVLAWRGHLGAERATTLRRVIRDAPCPTIILRIGA